MKNNILFSLFAMCLTFFLNESTFASQKEIVEMDFLPTPGLGHAVRNPETGALLRYIPTQIPTEKTNKEYSMPVNFERFVHEWQQEQINHQAFEQFVTDQFLSIKKQLEHIRTLLNPSINEFEDSQAPMVRKDTEPEMSESMQNQKNTSTIQTSMVLPIAASAAKGTMSQTVTTHQGVSSQTRSQTPTLTERLFNYFKR